VQRLQIGSMRDMTNVLSKAKRAKVWTLLICTLSVSSLASIMFWIKAPQDDESARQSLRDRPELKAVSGEFEQFMWAKLKLAGGNPSKIFGPPKKVIALGEPHEKPSFPTNAVLPLFISDFQHVMGLYQSRNESHRDFYEVGDIGYAEFFYNAGGGLEVATYYPRIDDHFVPLKTTDDFAKRLDWDKTKLAELEKWMNEAGVKL